MNVLSPGPYVYWTLVTGPVLLDGWQQAPAIGASFLVGFYLTMVMTLAGIIVLFAAAKQLGPRVQRVLLGVSGVALACFGVYELWLGITGTFAG